MNRSPLTALLVATLLGMATAASAVNPENHQKSATAPLDFELADARTFVRLSSLPAQTTLINFWRADCPPCLREMPLLADLARSGHVRVVTVALQRPSETSAAPTVITDALRPPLVSLHGPSEPRGLLSRFGNPQGALPHTVILDASRRPCARLTGEVTAAWLAQTLAHCPSL